jgi:hypothetical protein
VVVGMTVLGISILYSAAFVYFDVKGLNAMYMEDGELFTLGFIEILLKVQVYLDAFVYFVVKGLNAMYMEDGGSSSFLFESLYFCDFTRD